MAVNFLPFPELSSFPAAQPWQTGAEKMLDLQPGAMGGLNRFDPNAARNTFPGVLGGIAPVKPASPSSGGIAPGDVAGILAAIEKAKGTMRPGVADATSADAAQLMSTINQSTAAAQTAAPSATSQGLTPGRDPGPTVGDYVYGGGAQPQAPAAPAAAPAAPAAGAPLTDAQMYQMMTMMGHGPGGGQLPMFDEDNQRFGRNSISGIMLGLGAPTDGGA